MSHFRHCESQTHLLHLLRRVQHGANYHDSVQQVQRNPMWRRYVLCPPGEQQIFNLVKENNYSILFNFKDYIYLILEPHLIKQFPLLEANTTMGAMVLSSARWR